MGENLKLLSGASETMKVVILTYLDKKDDEKSYDVVIEQVLTALREGGHKVSILGVHDDPRQILAGLMRRKPDLVFNLCETFAKRNFLGDVAVAGVLELLQIPYTGGGPGELYLRDDKGLAKKLLAFDHINFP